VTDGDRHAEAIASLARRNRVRVGVAESLTCGKIAAQLGAAPNASEWLRGGVVAYASEVKFDVLGVTPGPVVTPECARQMASGAASVLGADAVVAVTGVGGPDPEEGHPPGTVYVATWVRGTQTCERFQLNGSPEAVLESTVPKALEALRAAMDAPGAAEPPDESGSGIRAGDASTSEQ
jgi:nicotinamide-nucleotide amidase